MIDFNKLDELRNRHAALHEAYSATSAKARESAESAARLRLECITDPDDERMAQVLTLPPDELAKQSCEDLQQIGIDPRTIRRALDMHRRATSLRQQADTLAKRLRESRYLIDRLNEYAQRFEYFT